MPIECGRKDGSESTDNDLRDLSTQLRKSKSAVMWTSRCDGFAWRVFAGASACRELICLHSVRLDGCELGCGCPSLADLAILSNEQKSAKGTFQGRALLSGFQRTAHQTLRSMSITFGTRACAAALSQPRRLAEHIRAAAAASASAVVLRSTFLDLGVNHHSRAPLSLTPTFACTFRPTHVAISHSSIDMYNNAQKFMKQTGDLKAATLYFAS